MKLSLRSALILLLWLAALRTLAVGMAANVKETTVSGYFPVAMLGLALGWLGAVLNSRFKPLGLILTWLILLTLGATFTFIHNGCLVSPLFRSARAGMQYQWQRIESRWTHLSPDPTDSQTAQAELTTRTVAVTRRLSTWVQNTRAGEKDADPLARQIIWSLPAFLAAAWAGWTLRRRGRALPAILPATSLLAFFQYYSEPDPLTFQIHLLLALMLAALTEGSAPVRRGLSNDTLTAAFLAAAAIIFLAGLVPSISAKAIAEAMQDRARTAQNDATAKALGLESGRTLREYQRPGLPRERLLQGTPQLARTVVFTVRTGDLPPMPRLPRDEQPPRYYWRTITYDTYTGRGWAIRLTESRDEPASNLLIDTIPTGYRLLNFDLTLTTPAPLPWTGQLVRANQPLHTAWRTLPNSRARSLDPLRGADLIAATSNATTFHVESILPQFTPAQLRAASAMYPDWVRDQYLPLPAEVPTRVRELATTLTADQPTAYDRAVAIESYLRRFPYTLNVPLPPADRDVADYFIFDLQTGYCDYYATAMVVLARAAGLPARLVSGYASGEYVPAEALYRVRASDAHSWVEVYFTDRGWVEFEPTANRPPIARIETQPNATVDLPLPEIAPAVPASALTLFLQRLATVSWTSWLAGILLIILLVFAFVATRDRLRQNTPIETITGIYRHIYRLGRPLLGGTGRLHTPSTFARALHQRLDLLPRSQFFTPARAELTLLTDLYIRALYSPLPPTHAETGQALRVWRRLVWRLRVARYFSNRG